MRCTLSPVAFASALSLVSRAVSPRSTLPVLGNVLLETTEQGLRVTATNLDLTIATTVAASVEREGRTTVPSRLLTDYIASLGDSPCTLELDPSHQIVRIGGGSQTTNLHGIDAVEFPPLPGADGASRAEIDGAELSRAIGQTVIAASSDEASPVLTGVLLQWRQDEGGLVMVATDRHRLAIRRLGLTGEPSALGEAPLIVPARHLSEVARAVSVNRPVVKLAVGPGRNQCFFAVGEVEVTTRLIDGTYPNYGQVIPAEARTTVTAVTEVLLRGARTAAVLAREAGNPVRLALGGGELTLLAQTAEVGDHRAAVEAEVAGEDMEIAFNARYLVDALSVIDTEKVQLGLNGPLEPGVVKPAGGDDYRCIIMPVRVP